MKKDGGFFARVYLIVAGIPPGYVMTYGQIARCLGSPASARVVGWAMRAAPEEAGLPCHRVVNRQGDLSPDYVFGSRELQRELLQAEGIAFLPDGRIDLAKHCWPGDFPDVC